MVVFTIGKETILFLMYLYFLFLVLFCAYHIFPHKITLHCFLFIPHQLFLYFLFLNFVQTFFDHTKFSQLNLIHSFVYICRLSLSTNLLHQVLFFDFQLLFFNICQKVINGLLVY